MLTLKLILVPLFLLLVSLAGRRWGPSIAGWLAGLPLVAGPILLFIALENGAHFASVAAAASLGGVLGSVVFSLVYSWIAQRHHWPMALLAAMLGWLLSAGLLALLPPSPPLSLAIALVSLLVAPRLFPVTDMRLSTRPVHRLELPLRLVAGALLTVASTRAAAGLGGHLSGLLAVFPLLSIVLAVFSHQGQGAAYVASVLRALATGLYAFVAFCFSLSLALTRLPMAAAFGVAIAATLAVQLCTRRWLMPPVPASGAVAAASPRAGD